MANNNFEILGTLSIGKESDSFKPYSNDKFASGWMKRQLILNVNAGTSRHSLRLEDGCWEDGHNDVFLFTKGGQDEDGNRIKGEKLVIKFKERLTSSKLPEVAEFCKHIIDLEIPGKRKAIKEAITKYKNGEDFLESELTALGVTAPSELEEALAKSEKKRHEFVSPWDYMEFLHKVATNEKLANKKFLIRGNVVSEYNDYNGKFYTSLVPQRIYLADDDAEEKATANIEFYFGNDSMDETLFDEKGAVYVNGFTLGKYSKKGEKTRGVWSPYQLALRKKQPCGDEAKDANIDKIFEKYKSMLSNEDDTYKKANIIVDMINGAEKVAVTMDDLPEGLQDLVLFGEITFEQAAREVGGSVYGDKVVEQRFVSFQRGHLRGAEDTTYGEDTFAVPTAEEPSEDDDELFDDDDFDLDLDID